MSAADGFPSDPLLLVGGLPNGLESQFSPAATPTLGFYDTAAGRPIL